MMNPKLCMTALALVASLGAVSASAQYAPAENFYTAGSSAQFNTFGLAASYAPVGALCGTHHWSGKNGKTAAPNAGNLSITLVDPRSTSIIAEPANIWIAWDNNAANQVAGQGVVCYYASVDSIVGVRAYAARATLSLGTNASGANDANPDLVPLIGQGEPLPAAIYNIVNNSVINAANTDIRPEDAKFATMRVLTNLGAQVTGRGVTGFGYGPGTIGTALLSSQSAAKANPVDFTLDCGDTDPINSSINAGCGGNANNIREYFEVPIGASPLMVIANVSQTGSGHLGETKTVNSVTTPVYGNINRFILRQVLEGTLPYVRDIGYNTTYNSGTGTWSTSEAAVPLNTVLREPLSGTYNTMEWSIPMALELEGALFHVGTVNGQESGNNPTLTNACVIPYTLSACTTSSGNPMWNVSSTGGVRLRAVGTGEMVATVNGAGFPDTIGYAFWGFSNFQGMSRLRYLTVDGVDPLYSGPADNPNGIGVLPGCTVNGSGYATSCPNLTFPNIVNGSYPIWSKYRLIYDPFTKNSNLAPFMAQNAQAASDPTTGAVTDFVPAPLLQVFRSHYTQVTSDTGHAFTGNNGFKLNVPETGGDMGGAILTNQSELDFLIDTGGNQQVGQLQ